MRKVLAVGLALMLTVGVVVWIFAPDNAPPNHLSDLLALSPAVNDAKQKVDAFYRQKGVLDGVGALTPSIAIRDTSIIKSIRISDNGNILVAAVVRSGQFHGSVEERVPIALIWRPSSTGSEGILEWRCQGTPAEFVPLSCRDTLLKH